MFRMGRYAPRIGAGRGGAGFRGTRAVPRLGSPTYRGAGRRWTDDRDHWGRDGRGHGRARGAGRGPGPQGGDGGAVRRHPERLLPGREEGARALAAHLTFLLEDATARAGLEGDAARLRQARTLAVPLLEPAVAAVLAVTVVGEHLPAAGWTGITLVVACLAVLTVPGPRPPESLLPESSLSQSSPAESSAQAAHGGA